MHLNLGSGTLVIITQLLNRASRQTATERLVRCYDDNPIGVREIIQKRDVKLTRSIILNVTE